MPWNIDKATSRIRAAISQAPEITSRRFNDYLVQFRVLKEARQSEMQSAKPLFGLPEGDAISVDTIQIYINIVNYDEYRLEDGKETEAAHKRALEFLHLYYGACDRLAENGAVMRVDFHGARMHAVILDEDGGVLTQAHVAQAFQFIEDFRYVALQANKELKNDEFEARFRFGIDAGPCIAISNGKGDEAEPLFLGSAANHAAKLADGDREGVFISDNIRTLLNQPLAYDREKFTALDQRIVENVIQTGGLSETPEFSYDDRSERLSPIMESWHSDVKSQLAKGVTDTSFEFHFKPPPLADIDYDDLMPSNSIRMPLVSIYADIVGYTKYIDTAIQKRDVLDAVRALYVIREEFVAVTQDDFGGRKVRLIGDCIHAVISEGSRTTTNDKQAVKSGAELAGGLRSSFMICQRELQNIDDLGLAIGVEFGETPITRLGIRGERSVRVASSVATIASEKCQQDCDGTETKFGDVAQKLLPIGLIAMLNEGAVSGADYGDFVTATSTGTSAIHTNKSDDLMNQPGRAYMDL